MLSWVICITTGILFIVIPYSAEIICKRIKKEVPYFLKIPKPIRYITISFIIFVIIFNTQMTIEMGME